MGTTHTLIMNQIGRKLEENTSRALYYPLPSSPKSTTNALTPNRNRLIIAAHKIFSIIAQLRRQTDYQDLLQLKRHLLKELQKFQNSAERFGYDIDSIMITRYGLSACLDEVINQTNWGSNRNWQKYCLLQDLQSSVSSNERFFMMLDTICRSPKKYIDTIEMMYICLNLGFEGKYQQYSTEHSRIKKIIDYTYQIIRKARGEFNKRLSPSITQPEKKQSKKSFSLAPLALTTFLIALGIFGGMNYLLSIYSQQAATQIQTITNFVSQSD